MKMKLYEFGPTRSIRVRWTLQELGADFESIRVNLLAGEHRHPEFLKINPAGTIPVLVDGDLLLTESVAIVLYLAEKYSGKGLLPAGLNERAQVNRCLAREMGAADVFGDKIAASQMVYSRPANKIGGRYEWC